MGEGFWFICRWRVVVVVFGFVDILLKYCDKKVVGRDAVVCIFLGVRWD